MKYACDIIQEKAERAKEKYSFIARAITDYRIALADREASPGDGVTTNAWCSAHSIQKSSTLAELCEKSGYILVLAPANPEKHLAYAEDVFKYKKHTYIDKMFAPDMQTAEKIFEFAKRYNTRFFSSSALRYAEELLDLGDAANLIALGGGRSMEEYIVHQIEMAVKVLEAAPVSVKVEKQGAQCICNIQFENSKNAAMVYADTLPFAVCTDGDDRNSVYKPITSDYFRNLISDILRVFETWVYAFDPKQTLTVMKIRTAVLQEAKRPAQWVKVQ